MLRSPPTSNLTVLPATLAPRMLVSPPLEISMVSPALSELCVYQSSLPFDLPRPLEPEAFRVMPF
ncbi:hypothetical protein D3C84_968220 [compost metagenome]